MGHSGRALSGGLSDRDCLVWYDADAKENYGSSKLLIADGVGGRLVAVPCGVMAAGDVMQGGRGVDVPTRDVDRIKTHLAKYYAKMGEAAPWDR